ncbi:MAG TPA: phosphatase PAP2 family protein [Candidatus Babeliales bacterium]|nr:phosphatase PAP2 family protein [Candidatus Babeliales bacterium]
MTVRALAVLTLLVAIFAPAGGSAQAKFYYLKPSQIDLTLLLPPPPDVASAQANSDEAQVAAAVAGRSQTEFLTAEEDSARTVFFFEPSIGPGFTDSRLPVTAAFFARIGSDVKNLIDIAKDYWNRPRPDGAEKPRGSYPSGHAAFAAASAIVLAQLLPAKRDPIFIQARTFAENRILLGLHYPSDVASGWTAGTLAAYVMMHDRKFARDFAAAQAELRRAGF